MAPHAYLLRLSRSGRQLTGHNCERLLSIDFQSIAHPEDLELDLELMGGLLTGEVDSYRIEKRYRHKSGH